MSEIESAVRFPGESDAYRAARDELLAAELELRSQLEAVAAQRRRLPPGGPLKEDYVFDELTGPPGSQTVVQVRLSELFADGKPSLVLYNFMYGPDDPHPCPMCTAFIDNLNGSAMHITQRANVAIVAKSPIARIRQWADARRWHHLPMLSAHPGTYNRDYFGETSDGRQMPMCNVFTRGEDGIRHFWGSEGLYAPVDGHPRHVDTLWALWNVLDLTPEGRGTDWMPRPSYE